MGTLVVAQNADDDNKGKSEKKVIIIKKTIDEDGNEVIEKIVKEGEEADKAIWIDSEGNDFELDGLDFNFDFSKDLDFDFEKLGDNMILLGDDLETLDILKLNTEELENMSIELNEKLKDLDIEIKELDGSNHKLLKIKGLDGDELYEMEFKDGEIPADVKAKLKAKGIKLGSFDELHEHNDFIFGHENKAFLGVQIGSKVTVENIDGEETKTVEGKDGNGAVVLGIIDGSAAEAAGLEKGDVIISIEGKEVSGHKELVNVLGDYKPDDKIQIAYLRDGKSAQTEATLTGPKASKSMNLWFDTDGEEHDLNGKNYFFFKDSDSEHEGHDFDRKNSFFFMQNDEDEDGEIVVKSKKKIVIIKKKKDGNEVEVTVKTDADDREEEENTPNAPATLDFEAMNVFPNPTDGMVQIQFKADAVPTVISITDVTGKSIFREELKNFDGNYNTQVDVSDAAKGTLLLNISQGKKSYTEKIIFE